MPPDRPDASGIETDIELISSQDYNFGENVTMNDKEKENASVLTDSNSTNDCQSEIPKWEKAMEKNSQSDDELTSLSWLHQQNLLKENNGKANATLNGNGQNYQHPAKNCQKPTQIFQESAKSHYNISPSNQTKISLSNNNLPMSYRNKHPTHIPYDPHLHRNSKPPYSFSCLIFMAIEDNPAKALPVKEVYAWILEHFPYFRNAPTGWKNSVRHNLSLNKCFRKVEKAPNLGKGSLWMVDAQYRPNLIQALSRAPFPPPTTQNLSSSEKVPRKCINTRLPDPVLFPYLSKRLASSNINDSAETEIDSDVDAAAAAMLSFKHGPIILNHNKVKTLKILDNLYSFINIFFNLDRKRKLPESEKLVPVITRSSSEDHTYSCIASIKLGSKHSNKEELNPDFDEQRKIAEGADALLNLAGVSTALNYSRTHVTQGINTASKSDVILKPKKRSTSEYSSTSEKRRKRWRDWGEENRYLKQIRG
ncbi:Forkhead box protein N3 [Trachymyrmex cornetzi]|uniref:Forkhead box protein N3 n=1 Tax=Trachymyrmex cornetzi TaxID=471704 RepID=A0A195E278_9HYME|nr:Forkhead box protein N3 [Trachymyrmex cornetzi]